MPDNVLIVFDGDGDPNDFRLPKITHRVRAGSDAHRDLVLSGWKKVDSYTDQELGHLVVVMEMQAEPESD